jgi:LCP family protein required for cell wall assembly
MTQDTQPSSYPPARERNRRYDPLADTQPSPWVTVPSSPAPTLVGRPRRSRISRRLPLLMLLLSSIGGLAVAGYVLWIFSGTLPRTNLLILGLDRRPEQGYVVRSDTMVLATVHPAGPDIALLSLPRDLYVQIPGYDTNRINTAHFWGENEFPGNGPSLAMQTVSLNLGVTTDKYVRVDFDGFRAVIDAAGGIDITVDEPIVDDAYPTPDYGTMRIEIPAGAQHMDGETALRYARSRHGSSDFDRAERQQQVLIGLVRRLVKPSTWPRLPAVLVAVKDNVDSNLTLGEMLLMAPTLYRVGPDGIQHHVIDRQMTQPWTTPTGGAVLLPQWEAIGPLVHELFTP